MITLDGIPADEPAGAARLVLATIGSRVSAIGEEALWEAIGRFGRAVKPRYAATIVNTTAVATTARRSRPPRGSDMLSDSHFISWELMGAASRCVPSGSDGETTCAGHGTSAAGVFGTSAAFGEAGTASHTGTAGVGWGRKKNPGEDCSSVSGSGTKALEGLAALVSGGAGTTAASFIGAAAIGAASGFARTAREAST